MSFQMKVAVFFFLVEPFLEVVRLIVCEVEGFLDASEIWGWFSKQRDCSLNLRPFLVLTNFCTI